MVLSEAMKNKQRLWTVSCLDIVQQILIIMNEAFLDH
jgi:hypothetical protein